MISNYDISTELHETSTLPGVQLALDSFIQLINAVEYNDITMLDFLDTFRNQLELTKDFFPLVTWAVLKRMITSLEATFKGASQPYDAIKVEAKNAVQISDYFNLMRDILQRIDLSGARWKGANNQIALRSLV